MARRTTALTRAVIRDAALELIDEGGLDGLSMRKLAARLGVQAPSLYSHYTNKNDLLEDVASAIMEHVDISGFGAGWREGLIVWARSYRSALGAHPNIVPFLAYGPSTREASLRRADAVHGSLVGAGWPPRTATMIGASTKYLVVGAAMSSFASGFVDDVRVYHDRYPNLVQAHRIREHADEIDRDSFELALAAFVTGLDAMYAAANAAPEQADPSEH
ncbi:TetR family transcriptional regulator [Rhodococcus triatomae]|uniref:Tetracyclin repressor, C-terminal all-alpha domain n=1 Tax=Rhodococcus triatomae TaxID=300028 RepID=A0A1G8QG35_9NOCA|nr:TetR family transcriptional regulator [Rhodococcus triatomae]QNG20696.1 TetR family transcriptional regulator [Rhodococcus triatomae]QNG23386.1 TetR family transcriptional regulator [Rhodococcus triatomae]SDJ03050.1 Tetracyclin repressor, C-terminal all-alpha domain [Rhodococcus triatomae]